MTNPELVAVLLSWATNLSGYPTPESLPEVQYVPHSFIVERACGNKPCRVLGWYPDAGIIYMDDSLQFRDDSFAASLLIHELVHFLQHRSGKFVSGNCLDLARREAEAYRVQNEYLTRVGNPALFFHLPVQCSSGVIA